MNNPSKLYPLVITKDLDATRDYYRDLIGCAFTHDMPGYLQVRFGEEEGAPELAFMKEDGTHAVFSGAGLIVSVPTPDADAKFAELKRRETPITSEPSDKPWRWRSFVVTDPNGVMLDFFHPLADAGAEDAAS